MKKLLLFFLVILCLTAVAPDLPSPSFSSSLPSPLGQLDTYYVVSAATTNAAVIKTSPGAVYGWYVKNNNVSDRKIMFHDTTSTPTAGANTKFPLVIPGGGAANILGSNGIQFNNGIAITTVTDYHDSGATAVAVNDLVITIFYK